MKFTGLGGCGEIGASSFILELDGTTLLLDAGVRPQYFGWDSLPSTMPLGGRHIDAVILSHCHVDHMGALPVLMKFCPGARIYMHESSADLAYLLFQDYVKVMRKQKIEHGIDEYPFYTIDEITLLKMSFRSLKSKESYSLYGHGASGWTTIRLTLYPAGHVLGACGALLEGSEGTVFYTGDICGHNQNVIAKAELPDTKVDLLIMESTHGIKGAELERNRRGEEEALLRAITEVSEGGGLVLIPAFALGRMQEILALLDEGKRKNKIPPVPIYTNGIGERITELYDLNFNRFPYIDPEISFFEMERFAYAARRFSGTLPKPPAILLASGGMLQENTFSFEVARRILPGESHAIFFSGYCAPDSPAWQVKNSRRGEAVRLTENEPEIPRGCRVESFNFTAHSYPEELEQIVKKLDPRVILLIHGEPESRRAFAERLRARFPGKEFILPENGIEWVSG